MLVRLGLIANATVYGVQFNYGRKGAQSSSSSVLRLWHSWTSQTVYRDNGELMPLMQALSPREELEGPGARFENVNEVELAQIKSNSSMPFSWRELLDPKNREAWVRFQNTESRTQEHIKTRIEEMHAGAQHWITSSSELVVYHCRAIAQQAPKISKARGAIWAMTDNEWWWGSCESRVEIHVPAGISILVSKNYGGSLTVDEEVEIDDTASTATPSTSVVPSPPQSPALSIGHSSLALPEDDVDSTTLSSPSSSQVSSPRFMSTLSYGLPEHLTIVLPPALYECLEGCQGDGIVPPLTESRNEVQGKTKGKKDIDDKKAVRSVIRLTQELPRDFASLAQIEYSNDVTGEIIDLTPALSVEEQAAQAAKKCVARVKMTARMTLRKLRSSNEEADHLQKLKEAVMSATKGSPECEIFISNLSFTADGALKTRTVAGSEEIVLPAA